MALNNARVQSSHVPYVPITVALRSGIERRYEALVDTGYTGFVIVPEGAFGSRRPSAYELTLQLADGSHIAAPAYRGVLRVGSTVLEPIIITELGDAPIVGMSVLRRFRLIIDHGVTLSVEP